VVCCQYVTVSELSTYDRFRTSGNNGRPAYEFPLGGSAWERAGASPTP
jgi:hypothetical protein